MVLQVWRSWLESTTGHWSTETRTPCSPSNAGDSRYCVHSRCHRQCPSWPTVLPHPPVRLILPYNLQPPPASMVQQPWTWSDGLSHSPQYHVVQRSRHTYSTPSCASCTAVYSNSPHHSSCTYVRPPHVFLFICNFLAHFPTDPAGRCAQAAETARSDWPVRPHPVVPVAYVTHTPLHTDSQKTQTLHTEWNPEGCFAQSWCLRWHSQQLLAAVLEAMHAKCTEDTVLSVVMWLQNLTSTAVRLRYSQTLLHSVLYDFFTLWSTSVFTHDSTPPLWNLLRSTIVNTLHTLRTPTLIALHRQLPNDTARAALQKLTAMPAVR
uniref:Uncharacterized protein n=2 Tax=Lygus hesperus TaxID=30085 RepID=A0A146LQ08_LYGHE